jgi:hypothetical protein
MNLLFLETTFFDHHESKSQNYIHKDSPPTMESSHYSSVHDQIITKARADDYEKSTLEIVEEMEKMREWVELHRPKTYKTCFTSEERKWLVELLCWESLCTLPSPVL